MGETLLEDVDFLRDDVTYLLGVVNDLQDELNDVKAALNAQRNELIGALADVAELKTYLRSPIVR